MSNKVGSINIFKCIIIIPADTTEVTTERSPTTGITPSTTTITATFTDDSTNSNTVTTEFAVHDSTKNVQKKIGTTDNIITTDETEPTSILSDVTTPSIEIQSGIHAIHSSTWNKFHPKLAVDNDLKSCSLTGYQTTPWMVLQLDHLSIVPGVRVVIWQPGKSCYTFLSKF